MGDDICPKCEHNREQWEIARRNTANRSCGDATRPRGQVQTGLTKCRFRNALMARIQNWSA